MKNIWNAIKTILLWAIGIFGMIYAVAVFLESTQVITKIFATLLFLVSVYILPAISKMLNFNIKPLITGAIFLVGFIGSIATVYNGTEAENLVKKEKKETSKTILYSTTDNLNVRKYGSINDKVLFQINKGDELILLQEGAEWSEIECEKGKGFVANEFITEDAPTDENIDWIAYVLVGIIVLVSMSTKRGKEAIKKTLANGVSTKPASNMVKSSKPQFICKYCGTKNETLGFLTSGNCSRSPSGKHVVFEGGIQNVYICEWCGTKNESLNFLTAENCYRSPSGKHQPFIGGVKKSYSCKFCNTRNDSLNFLTAGNCSKSPTGKHQPLK